MVKLGGRVNTSTQLDEAMEEVDAIGRGEEEDQWSDIDDHVIEEEECETSTNDEVDAEPDVQADQGFVAKLLAVEALCRESEGIVETLKSRLKVAREALDCRIDAMRELVRSLEDNENDRPLLAVFDEAEQDQPATESAEVPEAEIDASTEADWLKVSIGKLGLPAGILVKLTANGIDTIENLEELRKGISEGKKDWFKGIGPAKVTIIEDAVIDWLSTQGDVSDDAGATEENQEEEDFAL